MAKERFLLDTNSFVTPYLSFYPFDFAPAYWEQLESILIHDEVFLLDSVVDEIVKGDDDLTNWLKDVEGIRIIRRQDSKIIEAYQKVLQIIQDSPYYTDRALRKWSAASVADPWLIAAASVYGQVIVTFEKSSGKIASGSPSSNPKIPDIAREMDVRCEDLYYFMRNEGIHFG